MACGFQRAISTPAPGAEGYIGGTGGVTDGGRFIVIARFETEAAAQANSERAEQGAW